MKYIMVSPLEDSLPRTGGSGGILTHTSQTRERQKKHHFFERDICTQHLTATKPVIFGHSINYSILCIKKI